MKNTRTPLRKALDESRFIVLGAILIAVVYNVFADSRVPWVRAMPGSGDTASINDLLGADTALIAPIDTGASINDTIATNDTLAMIDTTALDAIERQRAIDDSIRAAVAARQAFVRDSIARAKAGSSTNVDA